jgi:hypothetical protein
MSLERPGGSRRWDHQLVNPQDPEKRIAELEGQLAHCSTWQS